MPQMPCCKSGFSWYRIEFFCKFYQIHCYIFPFCWAIGLICLPKVEIIPVLVHLASRFIPELPYQRVLKLPPVFYAMMVFEVHHLSTLLWRLRWSTFCTSISSFPYFWPVHWRFELIELTYSFLSLFSPVENHPCWLIWGNPYP